MKASQTWVTTPTVVWLTVVLIALPASILSPAGSMFVAVIGILFCLFALEAPLPARLLTAIAMAPAGFIESAPAWTWIGAGVAIGLAATLSRPEEPVLTRMGDLQRHLEWCRRREERAHLLVAFLPEIEVPDPFQVVQCFRVTDSVSLKRSAGGFELYALLDDKGFVREGLEARLSQWCGDRKYFGWATFPDDGVTIQALLEDAKTAKLDRPVESPTNADSENRLTQPLATKHV